MFLDISIRKAMTMTIIVLALFVTVYGTILGKQIVFGATPYFYTSTIGTRYLANLFVASVGSAGSRAMRAFGVGKLPERPKGEARSIPVLTYHRIVGDENDFNNVTVAHFKDQMEKLYENGWQTVTLADFEAYMRGEKELPEKSFLITFDDGAKESFYPVDPILRSLGFRATIFIIEQSANIAQKGSTYYLSPEEIHRMLKTGRWDIGSHSYDGHRPYPIDAEGRTGIFFADKLWHMGESRLESDEEFASRVRDDLTKARDEMQSTYGVLIRSFAFPLGNETGLLGAGNYLEGSTVTEKEARGIYEWGHIQHENQHFTFNFPKDTKSVAPDMYSTTTGVGLSDGFLIRRVHVDYDWDGTRLLSILENGRAKELPFEDDFTTNKGWVNSWGLMDFGRNNFVLKAEPEDTSASVFLDGSALWQSYSFDIAANWQKGWLFVLGDVVNSGTYHICSYAPGIVKIQSTIKGVTHQLKEARVPQIAYGDNVRLGIRVHGDVIECLWDFESIVEVYTRDFTGGVGIQTWEETPGNASAQIISAIARPYNSTTTNER